MYSSRRPTGVRQSEIIIDPFNLFGDELLVALRAPHAYQLTSWLTSNQGDELPELMDIPQHGRWVVCGYGRFGSHLAADLMRSGVPVTVIDEQLDHLDGVEVITGDATDPEVLARADLASAVAFAAATKNNDITNLSLLVSARKANGDLFTIAGRTTPPTPHCSTGCPSTPRCFPRS